VAALNIHNMPKVKNSKHKVQVTLPEGFELVDGQLTRKSHGGPVTGDQHNYGLTTFSPHSGNTGEPKDTDVRYSLSSVPVDQANLEAEGGETVLTDLNNDGQFGLYDIKGPRHSSGGVPMFLPEQSFIFSDTQKMKMGKEMLAEHGIKSRKKITPAKVSKKYELNKYYGILNDEYADKIQANTADLMLQKNKEGLSKLAFGQEMMKGFDDGLPLASYPYIQSIGIDPFEFAQQVEGLQQFTGDEQAQPMDQADTQAMNPMAQWGLETLNALNQFMGNSQEEQVDYGPMGPTPYQQQMINQNKAAKTNPALAFTDANFGQTADYSDVQNLGADLELQKRVANQQNQQKQEPEEPGLGYKLNRGVNNFMNSPGMKAFTKTTNAITNWADWGNEKFKERDRNQSEQDLLKMTMADNQMGISYDPTMKQGVYDENSGLIYDNMQGNPNVGGGYAGYGYAQDGDEVKWKTGDNLTGGTDLWSSWYMSDDNEAGRKKRYETYKILQKARGVDEASLPSEKDFHSVYLRSQKQINAIQDYYKDDPDYLASSEWDDGTNSTYYNKAIKEINEQIKEANPDATAEELEGMLYDPLNVDDVKLFQAAYQAGQVMNVTEGDDLLKFVQSGVDDDQWTYDGVTYDISPIDGAFGNTTVGQRENSIIPEYPCKPCPSGPNKGEVPTRDDNGDCPCGECDPCPEGFHAGTATESDPCPCIKNAVTPEVPEAPITKDATIKSPWIQDVIKAQSIADRERDMLMPWQPSTRRAYADVILENPDRQIAAINSQLAANQMAMGAFAGPQSLAARTAQAQGSAAEQIANAVGGVNQRNVNTVNQANLTNSQLENQFNQLEDTRRTKQYDDTQKVLQTYMDEKNFDREQYADSMSNLITNMSNTYNQNQLYDYFNIDPLTGGDIRQTGAKAFQANPEQDEWAFMQDYMEAAKRAKALGLTKTDKNGETSVDPEVIRMLIAEKNGRGYATDPREEAWKAQGRQVGGYGYKKGGENKVKKWASPFYTGKMGV
jgi:hypothetical protein